MSTKLWTGAVFVVVECTHELFRKAGRVGNYTSFFFFFFWDYTRKVTFGYLRCL